MLLTREGPAGQTLREGAGSRIAGVRLRSSCDGCVRVGFLCVVKGKRCAYRLAAAAAAAAVCVCVLVYVCLRVCLLATLCVISTPCSASFSRGVVNVCHTTGTGAAASRALDTLHSPVAPAPLVLRGRSARI